MIERFSGQAAQSPTAGQRQAPMKFSLIELLVVLAVIAILASVLLPGLRQTREQGRRTFCASNLQELATAAHIHAGNKDGWLPQTYHLHNSLMGAPTFWDADSDPAKDGLDTGWASAATSLYPSWDQWKRNGTPWSAWQENGATLGLLACPSATRRNLWGMQLGPAPAYFDRSVADATTWGKYYYASYLWAPGLQISLWGTPHADSAGGYNTAGRVVKPARRGTDDDPMSGLLAADEVYWSGPAEWGGANYSINHVADDSPARPAFQNLVFADGHVESKGNAYYARPLDAGTIFGFEHGSGGRGRWYWEP